MIAQSSLSVFLHVAGIIACHWTSLVRSAQMTAAGSQRFWLATKTRDDLWQCNLVRCEQHIHDNHHWPGIERQLGQLHQEVLATDLLTRMWAVTAKIIDSVHKRREIEPFAGSAFVRHQETRSRCLRLVNRVRFDQRDTADQLDRTRRIAERWSDMLLSHFASATDVRPWAFDRDRVTDFALSNAAQPHHDVHASLVIASLVRSRFAASLGRGLNPGLNARILESLLASFGPDVIDSIGPFDLLWQTRLKNRSHDLQVLLDEMLGQPTDCSVLRSEN